jgi:hypothetical protein
MNQPEMTATPNQLLQPTPLHVAAERRRFFIPLW